MSNRRKPRVPSRQHRAPATGPQTSHLPDKLDGLQPWVWAMQDADEAERRGDAAGALEILQRRMVGPDGRVYWRPSRLRWLEQLVMLGPSAPGWVRSRWILAQALQWLDDRDRGPGGRRARAVTAAAEIRGGLHRVHGRDMDDRRVQVMDHDWVFRQLFLYDMQGLLRFLRAGASPDLVTGADHVREWVDAPMGGFTFLGHDGAVLRWSRAGRPVATVTTPNIGTALDLEPGDHVLGRLVPVEGGVMYDGRVLRVPSGVAVEVEAAPTRWLDVLRAARDDVRAGRIDPHDGGWRALLSDISLTTVDLLLHDDELHDDELPDPEAATAVPATVRARAVIERAAMVRTRDILLAAAAMQDTDTSELEEFFEGRMDMVALIHGALTDPAIVAALSDVAGPDDRWVLEDLVPKLAEPSRSVVASALETLASAA